MAGGMLFGQQIDLEKTYTISKDAQKGFLGDAWYDDATGNYNMTYVTTSKKKFARFEKYTFSKDFEFVKMDKEELEAGAAKQKYPWWVYKGDEYIVEAIAADKGSGGKLVLKKIEYTYKYNWFLGMYTFSKKVLDKAKLKSENGDKYYYYNGITDEQTGEFYAVCGVKDQEDDKGASWSKIEIIKVNNQLDVIKKFNTNFTKPVAWCYVAALIGSDDKFSELGLVFNNGANNYSFLKFDAELNEQAKFEFTATDKWEISNFISFDNDLIYYGTSEDKTYTMLKITDNKFAYAKTLNIADFDKVLRMPPSQKKNVDWAGYKFYHGDAVTSSDYDLFVSGQIRSFSYNYFKDEFRWVSADLLLFQFDKDGNLDAQYGVDLVEKNEYVKLNGTPQALIEGDKNIYWLIKETIGSGLQYPCVFTIDKKNHTITDPVIYGNKTYYLESNFPYLSTDQDKKLCFFGKDKSDRTIWFCRIILE
jgi:hypothetical protein